MEEEVDPAPDARFFALEMLVATLLTRELRRASDPEEAATELRREMLAHIEDGRDSTQYAPGAEDFLSRVDAHIVEIMGFASGLLRKSQKPST